MILQDKEEQVHLGENDVVDIDDYRIAAANFATGQYTNHLGQKRVGDHFSLYLFETDSKLILGKGSQVTINAQLWLVQTIVITPTVETPVGYYSGSYAKLTKVDQPHEAHSKPPNFTLYKLSFFFSLSIAIYLYFIAFDDFSELQLIQGSYLWMTLMVFGLYGHKAQNIHQSSRQKHKLEQELQGLIRTGQILGSFALIVLFPLFKYERWSSFKIALLGALVWLVILEVFYLTVWNSL